jgi:hypothetical protein
VAVIVLRKRTSKWRPVEGSISAIADHRGEVPGFDKDDDLILERAKRSPHGWLGNATDKKEVIWVGLHGHLSVPD